MHITSPLCGAVNLNWSLRRRKTAAGVFMVAQERGGHASLSAGVFAILILWRPRLSGRDVRVRAGRRAGGPNLSWVSINHHHRPGVRPSIVFYICPLSWFKARLSAYSSPCHPSALSRLHSSGLRPTSSPSSHGGRGLRGRAYIFRANLQGAAEERGRAKLRHLSWAARLCVDTVPLKVEMYGCDWEERDWGRTDG